ncbi:tyrosine--tRNA ligase [Mycoplasmopsis synoviae]|nr:tyrosine--tRNA ligase [Mycoplasmopsis synoviae]AKB11339.1 tyrosyl-tRNA synthetase [Mycoplasmopsis synoviae ATCC 25204]
MHKVLTELRDREILKDISNEEKFLSLPKNSGVYVGFDPTADSLHLGNYVQIVNLIRFKKHNWNALAVLGGATGMIGDPSFRSTERVLLSTEELLKNKNKIKSQLESFGLKVFDNYEIYKDISFLDFLKNIGKLINVSYMLAKDSVKDRLAQGLSFTEFSYQIIQGYDFLHLYQNQDIFVQYGGSDQWGNITTGIEMISKVVGDNHKAIAITANLLIDSNGNKFGKSTGGGSLWLDAQKTKPFDMYQFLINQPDSEVEKLLKWLTFLGISEIKDLVNKHNKNPKDRLAQKALAYEVIKDIHGKSAAENCTFLSEMLFNSSLDLSKVTLENMEFAYSQIESFEVEKGVNLVNFLVENKILQSKRLAREFIASKSLKFNYESIDEDFSVSSNYFEGKYATLHLGKKKILICKVK